MKITIIKKLATKNPCYTSKRHFTPKGIMLHSVGTPQPNAERFADYWNNSGAGVCVHAVIQADGTVYKLLPWDYRAWHCGSGPKGSGNDTHIGIEMTEPDTISYIQGCAYKDSDPAKTAKHIKGTYKAAVKLFAKLCRMYGLNPVKDGTIISHREGHSRGIASNHGDPEHLWAGQGLTMKRFRKAVKREVARQKAAYAVKAACKTMRNIKNIAKK